MKNSMKKLLSLTSALALALSFSTVTALAADGLDLSDSSTDVPDVAFRSYLTSNFDVNEDMMLDSSEIAAVTMIDLSDYSSITDYSSIMSLKGIEKFTALTTLDVCGTSITELDLSKNSSLKSLDLNSGIQKLNVAGCSLPKLDLEDYASLTNVVLNADKPQTTAMELKYTLDKDGNACVTLSENAQSNFFENGSMNKDRLSLPENVSYDAEKGILTIQAEEDGSIPMYTMYKYDTRVVEGENNERYLEVGVKLTKTTTEKPDTEKPDTEKPDTEKPDTEKPDTEKPDTEKPDTETIETVTIKGRLLDKDGKAMSNVVVAVFSDPVWVLTDADGYYTLTDVPVGTHTLRAFSTKADFDTYAAEIKEGKTPTVKPLLEIANVVVSKAADGKAVVNIDGKLYTEDAFFVQVNADGTVSVTSKMTDVKTTSNMPKTGDTNSVAIFVALLIISAGALVVLKVKKVNSK